MNTEGVEPEQDAAGGDEALSNSDMTQTREVGSSVGGLSSVVAENFDVLEAMGGVRGLAETIAPAIVFIVTYLISGNLAISVVIPVALSIVAIAVRALQRIDVVPAVSGLLGVAISAVWAYKSGQASNFFSLGLLTNAAYLAVLLVSVLARWPLMGLIIGFLRGDATGWRRGEHADEPNQKITRRRYWVITWLWIGLFAARIAVQWPLLAANAVTALGIARIVMGPFGFALVAWLSWMMVRPLPPVPAQSSESA